MKKDFDNWNEVKKITHEKEKPRFYTVREVWWCSSGINIGTEQDGKGERFLRPCVIVCAFGPNACLVVPLTTSKKEHFFRVPVDVIQGKTARANISQMRIIDTRRLVEKIGFMKESLFLELKKRIRGLF